jgi:hypothetical protein
MNFVVVEESSSEPLAPKGKETAKKRPKLKKQQSNRSAKQKK